MYVSEANSSAMVRFLSSGDCALVVACSSEASLLRLSERSESPGRRAAGVQASGFVWRVRF